MWSTVQNSATEKAALFSLLDEYFAPDRTPLTTRHAPTTPSPSPAAAPRLPGRLLPPPAAPTSTRPTAAYIPSTSIPQPAPPSSTPTSFQTTLADQALQQPALSSAALRHAGLSPKAAGLAAQFGAKHHTVLAPHLANAAQRGWNAQQAQTGGGGGGQEQEQPQPQPQPRPQPQQPRMPPARGPKPPSGLITTSAKSFGKAITSLQAPMPKHDPSKAAYTESLATHAPIKSNHLPTPTYRTQAAVSPPDRTVPLNAASGLGRARALYDYEGAEEEDLQISEGEVVTVVEHVSDEWWKCQAEDGRKGIVPRAYLEAL
ncbi:hypothetical protein MVLG_01833 [Microbotryum lychnidis-dioicae p1A1 Lamole]|uniref:SH3 domain-containing protein n=1 Tax=Microbotryum lychnidis-dioicae (strain p1A1 Lamole / MvSl-1064) TaxID=683840 RepID=U5H3B1_USTV1|nr:hypothetical protein MVLG_01833 [Microbotryum lychnidis-dioicae p1A1 Lamole]|eukprot:KDE07924.1 hypothetical protein MVLG_01833 [Microbotryum lychnidis-dioicae p1A1 Lamole]